MINKWKNKLSIRQIRTFSFILALVFYIVSSVLSFKRNSFERIYNFLDLLAFLALFFTFNYKIDEKNFKLHSLIENKIEGNPAKSFLFIALIFTVLTLIGAFFSFRKIYQLGYNSEYNLIFQRILAILLFLTSSFWERRRNLKTASSL